MKGKKSNKLHSCKKPSKNTCLSAATNSWFTHDYFSKYWQYYNYSTQWYMNHLNYIRNASQSAEWPVNMTMAYNQQSSSISSPPWHPNQQRSPSYHHKKQHNKFRHQRKSSSTCTATELMDTTEDIEMKVPDSLLDFMIVSRKFREEREALKNEQNAEDAGQCVNIEDVTDHLRTPSILPPSERPGSQRTSEIKQLYGKKASLIHSMETALQMTYDQMVDLKQPKMWPNMPLKIVFS
ncbi:gem-associated protein 8 [Octopus sinensis]|uniref:Gem-associated protein 8 n=1 Tax=Octopus sinensis TaxID=2607531 RepID=A0A6P7T569_9MOLL|nr:gem-associated protein 8 [Octopus sinensis]